MKINHTVMHYMIGGTALALAGYAGFAKPVDHTTPPAIHASRFDWPVLGQDKSISLGETLGSAKRVHVTLFCSDPSCAELRKDLDDALQVAGWDASFENRPVDSESDKGIFVGPPGPDADNVISALGTVGIHAEPVGLTNEHGGPFDGVGIILGQHGVTHENQ